MTFTSRIQKIVISTQKVTNSTQTHVSHSNFIMFDESYMVIPGNITSDHITYTLKTPHTCVNQSTHDIKEYSNLNMDTS